MTFRSGVAKNAAIPALDPAPAIRGNGYKTGCRWRSREGLILSRYNTIDWQCHIDKKRLTQLANITYFQHENRPMKIVVVKTILNFGNPHNKRDT